MVMRILRELLVGLGTALATAAGLFALQLWYASYLDVAVVHGGAGALPMNAQLAAVRSEEHAKLSSGAVPIGTAMAALAQHGRNAYGKIAARPSDDLSPMSGWIHRPGFRPYVPRSAAAAALAAPAPATPEGAKAAR